MTNRILYVEDDPFLRLIGVILDPATDAERIAAYADFFAHDLADFDGWLQQLRARLPHLFPANVALVDSDAALSSALKTAEIAVVESLRIGAPELTAAPRFDMPNATSSWFESISSPVSFAPVTATLSETE